MLRLEKRPNPSKTWAYLAPVLAVFATMIGGGIMFAALGKDPLEAIRTIFYDPLFSDLLVYRPHFWSKRTFDHDASAVDGVSRWDLEHWS